MNCDICNKSFTGLVCFQQHEASEKHKKKLRFSQLLNRSSMEAASVSSHETSPSTSTDSQIICCSICGISFTGLLNFQKHANSLEHANMIKNNVAKDPFACDSDDTRNSEVKQNINAECNMPPNNFVSVNLGSFTKCEPCRKEFSGPEPYKQHLASEGHKKKSVLQEIHQNKLGCDTVEEDKIMQLFKPQDDMKVTNNYASATISPYATCKECDMQFSGPEPYQLHLESIAHQRKAAIQLNSSIQSMESSNGILNSLRCGICDKDFSGTIPYNQHMSSNIHKKKIQNVQFFKSLEGRNTSLQPDSTTQNVTVNSDLLGNDRRWYCEVCKKQSTGPIPHNQHLVSEAHRKNVRATEIDYNLQKIRDSNNREQCLKNSITEFTGNTKLNELSGESKINNLNFSNFTNDDKTNDFYKDFRINNDLIFCDALKNVGITSPEDVVITIFKPEEEIVFDSTVKKNDITKFYSDLIHFE